MRFAAADRACQLLHRDIGMAASATLKEYFGEILPSGDEDPQDDLISTLAESEIDGERLSDEEIFAFLLLILPAGVETTYRASGCSLWRC